MRHRRLQFGLRLMLLSVALLAVLLAWLSVRRDLRRETIRAELYDLKQIRENYRPRPFTAMTPKHRRKLLEINAQIAEKRKRLGEALAEAPSAH